MKPKHKKSVLTKDSAALNWMQMVDFSPTLITTDTLTSISITK